MNTIEFWDGQFLELETSDNKLYFTQIVNKENELIIRHPVSKKNVPMSITNATFVDVYFYDDVQGMCTFESTIQGRSNQLAMMNMPSIDNIKKVQRRRYFRIQLALETYLTLQGDKQSKKPAKLMRITYDISGGGLSFLSDDQIVAEEDIVEGKVVLQSQKTENVIEFTGRIVNVMKQENQMYRISLEFIDMKESIRSQIISFCMQKQIEIHKKLKDYTTD